MKQDKINKKQKILQLLKIVGLTLFSLTIIGGLFLLFKYEIDNSNFLLENNEDITKLEQFIREIL